VTPAPRLALDHIAVAVGDLAGALEALGKVLPVPPSPVEELPSEALRLSFLEIGGVRLELMEPTGPASAVARSLEKGRSGLHHICFRIEEASIDEWCEELRRRGVEVIGAGPRPGAGGSRVFFVHPRSAAGILIEFSQGGGIS
jgi:methylmalonyl-CoA/ethylmalonyl-CoA epimerase